MGRHQAHEFSGRYDLCLLPEPREMLLIACNQIVRARGISTFQKHVVIGIGTDVKTPRRFHHVTSVLDELKQLVLDILTNTQLRASEHSAILRQNRPRDIESRGLGDGDKKDRTLQPAWLDGGRDYNVRINDQAEMKHYRLGFLDRELFMIRSIWREVKALTPFVSDS